MVDLVDAYLSWKHGQTVYPDLEADVAGDKEITVQAIDFFGITTLSLLFPTYDHSPNISLARRGYLGTAPLHPHVAITFRTLEAYRQLHRVCPKLSIYANIQALCHLHGQPFERGLVQQFSAAFDVYLELLHRIDIRVNVVIKRDEPEYRLRHVCPPCMYKLTDEPNLELDFLFNMDGNSSLKLVDSSIRNGSVRQDNRTHRVRDMYLSPDTVDRFKDEVSPRAAKAPLIATTDGDIQPPENLLTTDNCVEKWKAAAPEERKRAFALFHITGVFASFCRHGHPLVFCDMVRSGELRKYALAVTDKLMDVFGNKIGLAYDVGCDTWKTVLASSLRDRALKQRLRLIVPAFHGHSHNRLCQLDWHPMYIEGAGKEDFEGCERAFRDSNMLASGTRLATAFHRHQAIEQHWSFRSFDKYADCGTFILNNYKQALSIIRQDGAALANISRKIGTTTEDYVQFLKDEKTYLQGLKTEPEETSLRIEYLMALQELDEAELRVSAASAEQKQMAVDIATKQLRGAAITAIKNRYRHAWKRLEESAAHVAALENRMSIQERWKPTDDAYREAESELAMRRYRIALDKLEFLVVQRILELSKISMGNVAYKLREKIGQALRTRADAIRKALDNYNKQAVLLKPPRPKLRWEDLVNLSSVGDFDLLRNARQDIRQLKWADPVHREATRLYFNIERAKEELVRCNIEIRRLLTWMRDEHFDYCRAIAQTMIPNFPLAHELSLRWVQQDRINARLARRLKQVSELPGFTGELRLSTHVTRLSGGKDNLEQIFSPPSWIAALQVGEADPDWVDVMDGEGNDSEADTASLPPDRTEEIDVMVDFLDRLELS
ncbi:hypothetical protein BC629DRAFT_526102 [Irpex lacteus]|nr:hypothetical protein BC629DRAFT_526102 [Irpex lacteus]